MQKRVDHQRASGFSPSILPTLWMATSCMLVKHVRHGVPEADGQIARIKAERNRRGAKLQQAWQLTTDTHTMEAVR
jgi:hypothetical protein